MAKKIKILSFGKKKSDSFNGDIERFAKMSKTWVNIEYVQLKPIDGSSIGIDVALEKEGEILRKKWGRDDYIISLGEEGKLFTSEKLAKKIEVPIRNGKDIVINIGSAYGLSDSVKQASHLLLSLSPLTFTYRLCKLVLAEQLYRTLTIINNHPYHKE